MLLLFLSNFCFAVSNVGHKFLLTKMSPLLHITLRMFLPGFVAIGINLFRNPKFLFFETRKTFFVISLIVFGSTLCPLVLKGFALQQMPLARFSVLCSIDPFVAAFWTTIFFGEVLVSRQVFALFFAVAGVLLVLLSKIPEGGALFCGIFSSLDLAVILSVFLGKLGWLLGQQMIRSDSFGAGELNSIVMFGAGSFALAYSFISGEIFKFGSCSFDFFFLGCVTLTLLVNTLGYYLFSKSLKVYPFTLVSIVGCGIPIISSALGYLVYGEIVSFSIILAIVSNFVAVRLFVSAKK